MEGIAWWETLGYLIFFIGGYLAGRFAAPGRGCSSWSLSDLSRLGVKKTSRFRGVPWVW
jgi:hypothetical protein